MQLFAHTGHWSVSLLYLAPFAAVGLWLLRDRWRQRGARTDDSDAATSEEASPGDRLSAQAAPAEDARSNDAASSDRPAPTSI